MRLLQFAEPAAILIDRVDLGADPDQLTQSQREGARSRAEVRTYPPPGQIPRFKKFDVILMVHGMPGRILSGDDKIRGLEIAVSDFVVHACFAFPNGRII